MNRARTDDDLVRAQFIAPPDVPHSHLDVLEALVARSLLRQEGAPGGDTRFEMLETIREYASEQLEASGELPAPRDRHLAYYLAFAEAAHPQLQGSQQARWFDRLERENDNLRAGLGGRAGDDPGAGDRLRGGAVSADVTRAPRPARHARPCHCSHDAGLDATRGSDAKSWSAREQADQPV